MRTWILIIGFLVFSSAAWGGHPENAVYPVDRDAIALSRTIAVRILVDKNKPAGSGFFIDAQHIVTCWHVIAREYHATIDNGKVKELGFSLFSDINVEMTSGERLSVEVSSVPTKERPEPVIFDFAVLRLSKPITNLPLPIQFYKEGTQIHVGDDVFFSGYPLDSPILLSHRGTISGLALSSGIIALQAPINKGHSGSAVISKDGTVLGIVSYRLGGIGKELSELRQKIGVISKNVSMQILGLDPLQVDTRVIDTLDQTISTGIGYARSIVFVNRYLNGPKEK